MKRLLITALSLLLVFNGAGYQVINATEVDTQGEKISETSLPTEETDSSIDTSKEETNLEESNEENSNANVSSEKTNFNDSDEENTDTNVSTEENDDAVNDTTVDGTKVDNTEDSVQDSDSIDNSEAQIATVASWSIQYLDKTKFKKYLSDAVTDIYFGTKTDYKDELTKCTEEPVDLGNGYKLYNYTNGSSGTVEAYVICEDGKKIIFPEDSTGLFSDYTAIKQITFNNIDTSNVTSMNSMFHNCGSLSLLDLSKFNTSKATDMVSMFSYCVNLSSIKLSSLNTENVTNMTGMFAECYQLASLDLSNFNTSKVTDMSYMFGNCKKLSIIDLSSFNTSEVTDMHTLFYGCNNLKTIYVTTFFKVPDNSLAMFADCSNLIGGQGTKYDSSKINHEYAHIDDREYNPGYFTALGPDKPTLSITETYKYNGNEQIASVTGFDSNTMEITDNKKTNAGTYTIKVTSKTGRWSDGTKDPVTIEWTIEKADPNPDKPTNLKAIQGDTLSEVKLPSGWSWNEPNTQIDDSGSKTYKATFTPTDTENYKVLDNIELTVDVEAAPIKPTLSISGEYTYNGNEQTANVNGFDSNTMEITDNKKTNAGTYTVSVKPKTQWSDGTNTPVTVEWIIKKADATKPSGLSATQGDKLSDIQLPNGWKWDEPDTQITNNGTQTFKASYIPTGTDADNYNESKNVDLTVSVEAAPDKPVLSITGTYTYNGSEQTVTVTGFDSNTMEITGNKKTDVGTYTVTVKPKTQWSDGTNSPVTVEWTIEKANPTYTVPTDLKANQGDKLSDIKLPEGWSWNEPDTKLDASGSKTYTASYTPKDTNNYNVLEKVELTVTVKVIDKSSDNSSSKQTSGWDDGGPFTTDKCGNVFDRWNNKIYEANGCNVGGYNLVRTSVID